jgi:hypothetical protein
MRATTFRDTTLAPKAAFDLQCPKDDLVYEDLGGSVADHDAYGDALVTVNHQNYFLRGDLGRQQGVTGCGRRASYAYVRGAWVGAGATDRPASPAK